MEDTIRKLRELGIQTVGGGMNIHEARKPASIEKNGLRVACLQYNTIGPRESWASPLKAGSAFIRVETHYVNDKADPGGLPSRIYTTVDPATLQDMEQDIAAAPDEAGKKQRACELQRAVFEEHALFTPLYVSMQQAVKQPYVVNDGINVANATSWTPEEVRIQK